MWIQCTIHRESLATQELCSELREVMDTVCELHKGSSFEMHTFCRMM
jgi:hypothetical protein